MTMRLLGALFLSVLVAACAQTDTMESDGMAAEGAPPPEMAMQDEGAKAEATEPMQPEPMQAEPMQPAPAEMPDEYTLYFDFNSPILTPEAEAVIDEAVAAAVAKGKVGFAVTGYADTVGSSQQNQTMSRWRAQAVADELVFRGVSEGAIDTTWHGAEGADGMPADSNRRVVIQLL